MKFLHLFLLFSKVYLWLQEFDKKCFTQAQTFSEQKFVRCIVCGCYDIFVTYNVNAMM